jgi:hypothetical protein
VPPTCSSGNPGRGQWPEEECGSERAFRRCCQLGQSNSSPLSTVSLSGSGLHDYHHPVPAPTACDCSSALQMPLPACCCRRRCQPALFLSPFVISPLLRLCSPHRVTRKRGREQRKLREHQYPGSAQSSVYRVCPSLLKR